MTTIPGAGTSIVIDPGAAIGLIGSETLRDLLQLVDKKDLVQKTTEWTQKHSEVTGISGSEEKDVWPGEEWCADDPRTLRAKLRR